MTNSTDLDDPASDLAPEMAAVSSATTDSPQATGLGELARRCRRRTTDLLAIGLLVVVGLAVGRQLTAWWNEPELESISDPLRVTGSGAAWTDPDDMQLGELGQEIQRRRVSGDRKAAWSALEESTRITASRGGWPESEADPSERQLLAVLDRQQSRASQPTRSKTAATTLHRLEGPLPMVVAVRQLLGQRRVVGWGLATRSANGHWVTWTFAAAGHFPSEAVQLPEGSRRLLAVGSGNPERLVVFSGSAGRDDWWRHFDEQLRLAGWTLGSPADRNANGWTARWHHDSGQALIVSARHHKPGEWRGMLNVFTPVQPESSPETSRTSPTQQVQREST